MAKDKSAPKNYIVTGAAGFIGSHLAKRLIDEGHTVWVVDNLSTGKEANIPDQAIFLKLDIARADAYRRFPTGRIDAVLHLAAQSSGEISDADPAADLESNLLGTVRLLDWCRRLDVPRFIFAGTMGVYGHTEELPAVESCRSSPTSFYGASKLAAENYVRLYAAKGLRTTIFRIFNAYGPGQNLDNLKQGMVSIYLAYLIAGQPILVKGSLERFRDFIYIDDLADAWLLALNNPIAYGKTYNLAGGKKILVRDLLVELIRVWGAAVDYPINAGTETPGDVFGIYANVDRIKDELNWEPKTELSTGLARMVKWAKAGKS